MGVSNATWLGLNAADASLDLSQKRIGFASRTMSILVYE
jgi:hypothetical protein